ncbi:filamentous hemagglutinin N-terminal domain-containing protein [Burkholderia sp. Ac-20384]|uniref:filamentous haemagglutinin family protein n=1 Tax=Burkholderia sp. Ac-20384 TaxID=2703902 RepID=UPI00197FEF69|nr:filamentous haemagglutinin family protein [Burkholderia sp. Ac-20384]MBN3824098.1 filamentous hemagglutinin N-terminal domain-containing protein [Burkholderia sp. Ac-20384]
MAARARTERQLRATASRSVLKSELSPLYRAVVLMLAAGVSAHAHAAGIMNLGHVAASPVAGGAGGAGGVPGIPNLGVSPQQALQASQPSIRNLGYAAHAIAAQIAAQQNAAAAAAKLPSTVPNGLAPGGLQVAAGATGDTNNPVLWVNANAPTQNVDASGHVNVDVKQTGQNAVLTWETMNVGRQTTLNFDQSGGTQTNGANNWAVLNRINDPSGRPSQILGNITAQGAVYVINRNGVLFGAGSQVNVHSLVASSLDVLNMNNYNQTLQNRVPVVTDSSLAQDAAGIVASNKQFLSLPAGTTGGLAYPQSGSSSGVNGDGTIPNEVLGLGNQINLTSASQYRPWGDVTIEQGASITTHANGNASDGGFVMIAAPNVTNAGHIKATDGQVVLAAGVGVSLRPVVGTPANPQVLLPELSGRISLLGPNGQVTDITPAGTLTNTGIVEAARGNVNLLGSRVAQNGVVGVTTSVNTPGAITISTVDEYQSNNPTGAAYFGQALQTTTFTGGANDTHRAGLLSFGPDSVTTVMPDGNGQTTPSTPGATFTPGSIGMTAGSIWFQGGSLIEAPGSKVSVTALTPSASGAQAPAGQTAVPGRIYLDSGATIDVSGLANVEVPISQSFVTVDRIGQNELADSPLLRNGFLLGYKNLVFDSTLTGTRSDGVQWVGSPILNLSGYVNLIPRTVDQLLTNGGSITLSGNEVMTATGSSMNLNGGYVHYDGGIVNTTRLVDANGALVPIGQASPYDTYVGIAGQFVESHPRWGVTKTWYNPLLTMGTYQGDYIVGGNAGTLDIYGLQSTVLDGDISAQAFGGAKQMQGNSLPSGGTFNLGADPKLASGALVHLTSNNNDVTSGTTGLVVLQDNAPQLTEIAPGFSIDTPLDKTALQALPATDPRNVLTTTVVPVATLNNGGFANLNVTEDKVGGKGVVVPQGTQLNLQPGGSITLNSPVPGTDVNVAGRLSVPSGSISITSGGNVIVGPQGVISTAGQWVNNDVQAMPGTTPGNGQFINGGSITLSALLSSNVVGGGAFGDTSGSVLLQPGSVLDVSSGGELLSNGQMLMQNGVPAGRGGNVTLQAYSATPLKQFGATDSAPDLPTVKPTVGTISMGGTILSEGFSGGGTLTLQALGFQIGGDVATASPWDVYLPGNFFARQGFGKYVLNAFYDATVAPGAAVAVTQLNRIPDMLALQQAGTGANLSAGGLTAIGQLDAYHRQATNLVLTGGNYTSWRTATGATPSYPGVTGAVTLSEGASIQADAGASIGLGSPTQVTVLGSIIAPGGAITLSADGNGKYAQAGQFNTGFRSASQSVWLGVDASLDVSGTALTNPLAAPVKIGSATVVPDTGKVLAGGSVTMSSDTGYVVAQSGSKIDVSGTSANFDQLQPNGTYASQPVWSDAGSITLSAANGLFADATLAGHPGAAQARGGTLTVLSNQSDSTTGTAFVVRQGGALVPVGLAPGQDFTSAIDPTTGLPIGQPTGVLQFAADRLKGSGIANLVFDSSMLSTLSGIRPTPVLFAGDVTLALPESVTLNAGRIAAIGMGQLSTLLSTPARKPDGTVASVVDAVLAQAPGVPLGTTVEIDAPYVALSGPTIRPQLPAFNPVATLSDATLNVNASFIDLKNQFQLNNFGHANFTSSGDIRLSSATADQSFAKLATGVLYTPGDLTFKAADLYPSTGSTFVVAAVGPTDSSTGKPAPTTVTFVSNGVSGTPLSAGGTLLVDATDIVQGGTVRAPSGTIVLGVGDPSNAATQAQFAGLPLVATDSVRLASGSVTSVSNERAVIPYGTTIDGVEWQFNPVAGATTPDLTAPPAKYVGVNGSNVALDKDATIDLSGGGDLQAAEWVPGTGGTRDVLSQYNVSYASGKGATAVPVNVGGGNVYAIVPGAQSPVAAYDPMFAQTQQPSTNANGAPTTATMGVGQAGLTDSVGKAVYLSGVPGLPAGYYTLLPGKYATLPGAYRVTVSGMAGNVVPGASQVLPDGTVVTAGYFGDALTGGRSATPTLFNVQSNGVWQQYSQYTLTGANGYFTKLAATKGNVTPPLPVDGGQLVLAATKTLALGATLNAAAGAGGAPAEVDIASQDIQITGSGSAALPGYLQIGSDALDSLNAGSLLIGGTRAATTSGVTITPIANSVVLSNDGNTTLNGPEILLVTKTDGSGTDPNAANGLRVDAGASIAAQGDYPAAKDQPIAIAGDGALLRVSNGAMAPLSRTGGTGTGLMTVGAGATLAGGQALLLDSSGNLKVDPTAVLSAKAITADGSAITFTSASGAAATNLPGFVVDPAGLAQFANAQQVTLRSYGAIGFVGDVSATFGNSVDLSAGTFTSDGGHVTLNAQQVAFTNEMGATPGTATAGNGTLTVNAKEIDFGTGTKAASGFGSAVMNATGGIVGQGTGTFDFGALPVTLGAPVYLADTSSASTVKTTGALTLNGAAGTALTRDAVGGAWTFKGGAVADNGAKISAPAGNVTLEATTGNLTIGGGSTVSSAGVSKQFFDVTRNAPAGSIKLTADAGTVDVQSGSTLDFSGASGGGAAGSLALSAPQQVVNLNGTIKGGAASGYAGGSFSLNTGGAADLDALSKTLASSGVNQAIEIHTKTGNLTLSQGNTLTANSVLLTADGGAGNAADIANGNINVLGTIDASGKAGGEIDLYGRNGVDVEGSLLARGSDPNQRGGKINIGTTAVFDPTIVDANGNSIAYNATYGYENILRANAGAITLGANALIDVSGGTAGGLSGGTVNFRAPLLIDNGVKVDLPEAFNPGKGIVGSRATSLEAYAVWSTTDATTGAKHFDGVIDPAGWYDKSGHLLSGTFTAQGTSGTPATFSFTPDGSGGGTLKNQATGVSTNVTQAQLQSGDTAIGFTGLNSMYFAPASGGANTDHQTFYGYQNGDASSAAPGTLMGFVQHGLDMLVDPFAGKSIANTRIVPGIELDNPSPAINGGDIQVLTNWNLGAGASPTNLAFRFDGQAPVVTLRAENNVKVKASLSDGFFQIANPLGGGGTIPVPPLSNFNAADTIYTTPSGALGYAGYGLNYFGDNGFGSAKNIAFGPGHPAGGTPDEIAEYYALYSAYAGYLAETATSMSSLLGWDPKSSTADIILKMRGNSMQAGQPVAPVAPSAMEQATNPASYLLYLNQYKTYLTATAQFYAQHGAVMAPHADTVAPPAVQPVTVIATTTIDLPAVADNTPSPVSVAGNPLPLLSASLAGGASSSFRVVAGADLGSTNPLALQPFSPSTGASGNGSVTLGAHSTYVDASGLALLAPTMIRTGTGAIDVAAANGVALFDATETPPNDPNSMIVPGVIYTAGAPAAGAPAVGGSVSILHPSWSGKQDILISPTVNPDSAGDITIHAQGDVVGAEHLVDTTGAVTGQPGSDISQFWWQWMQVGNPTGTVGATNPGTQVVRTSINYGAFDQGVLSAGGNVSVSAGGNIADLSVSLPTTWWLTGTNTDAPTVNTVGGGNLTVHAGGDILSGGYFVAKGTGTITAGGKIGSDLTVPSQLAGQPPITVDTLLATQDGVLDVNARQGVSIGRVFDPSYAQSNALLSAYKQQADMQGYSSTSAVNISATTGDVTIGTLSDVGVIGGGATSTAIAGKNDLSYILPASVDLTAFTGGITVAASGVLAPSSSGNLNLIADQSINLSSVNGTGPTGRPVFGLLDVDPSSMPSPARPNVLVTNPTVASAAAHDSDALHGNDTVPARIYSLGGDIVDGILRTAGANVGFYDSLVPVVIDKPALLQAGRDIVNLSFLGQNLRKSDVTRIVAGRDIYDTPLVRLTSAVVPALVLGGPGTFDVEAGRNIGPLTSQAEAYASLGGRYSSGVQTGIDAIGNGSNPYLPHESASVNVLFGVGPGIDTASFVSTYVDPAKSVSGVSSATPALITFMEQYEAGLAVDTGLVNDQPAIKPLTADEAWSKFKALPQYVQQLFAEQVLFKVLTNVGEDYNNPASPFYQKYARGYDALNTMFPASLGYTANNLGGGSNGANKVIDTGDLDIRSTTIQTQQGGNVSILGPGGQALVGSTSAPPQITDASGAVIVGPGTMGILTLEKGDIDIFTDRSVLLAQSRIFTEQGGDMTIWSSNGDINAGKGAKSSADTPAPQYVCDANHYCTVDARGQVTGAGIATLQSVPGVPIGTINLIAPRGTVDAGDAGIRAGNLNIAALRVVNADNIQVTGKATGVPLVQAVNTGALTAASAAASAATQAAQDIARNSASGVSSRRWTISVQVEGFGDAGGDGGKKHKQQVGYDASSSVSILGFGQAGPSQRAVLTAEERARLGKI